MPGGWESAAKAPRGAERKTMKTEKQKDEIMKADAAYAAGKAAQELAYVSSINAGYEPEEAEARADQARETAERQAAQGEAE